MAEEFAKRKHRSLARRILRAIGGEPIDVKRFETHPHRMRRIREPPVGQRVSEQQIAVFVVNAWDGKAKERQEGEPNANHGEEENPNGDRFSRGKPCKWPRNRAQCFYKP